MTGLISNLNKLFDEESDGPDMNLKLLAVTLRCSSQLCVECPRDAPANSRKTHDQRSCRSFAVPMGERCDDDDLNQELRGGKLGFDRCASRKIHLVYPGLPGCVHLIEVADVGQIHCCRKESGLVRPRGGQHTVDLLHNL